MNTKAIQSAILGILASFALASSQAAEVTLPGKPLLSNAKAGLFVHYVYGLTPQDPSGAKVGTLDEFANALDVEALAETTKQAGAEYLIFTAYHAGMRMLYPSKLWGGVFPDKVSKRDLIGDLADALKKRGLFLVLYIHPNDRHDLSKTEQQRLIDLGLAESILSQDSIWLEKTGSKQYTGLRGGDPKWNEFYFKLVDEIGQRYGSRIAGYWQDGPGPDGDVVRGIMQKHTPNAAIWLNSAASRADLPPATLLGGEYICRPSKNAGDRTAGSTSIQNCITVNGDWWATNHPVLYPPENLFRSAVTSAATKGQVNGGFVVAAGPFANNTWGPGMADTLKSYGALMNTFAPSIYGTVPGTAYVTTGSQQPAWGVCTESPDGKSVYLHILRPPAEKKLLIADTEDGRKLGGNALILGKNTPVQFKKLESGYEITLPDDIDWNPIDTVIKVQRL